MTGVVHVICATVKPDADEAAVRNALDLAHGLRGAEGTRHVIVGRSPGAIATATWLDNRDALEPFAASPVHMAFIMRGLAPCIRGMWSAAVETDTPPPAGEVAALWVCALPDSETLYEWQVRDLLHAIDRLPGAAAVGATIEERERYRGGGAVSIAREQIDAFRRALAEAARDWGELGIASQLVEVDERD